MNTKRYVMIMFFIFCGILPAQPKNDIMNEVVQNVNIDSLMYFVKELSGEVNITLNGQPTKIVSRHKDNADNAKAADYLYQKLSQYNSSVVKEDYSSTGRNICAVQLGNKFPNQKVIICAHYDCMPAGNISYGADDNGSGTAAVIEAARLLKNYTFPFTIVYALWDEEEGGHYGSKYYANNAAIAGDTILAVVNMDMIGWNRSNSNVLTLGTRPIARTVEMANKMCQLNSILNIGLSCYIENPGGVGSDHASFWSNNYTAMEIIEDGDDFNDFYHTLGDTIGNFNAPYFLKCAKLSIATLVDYALNMDLNLQHQPVQSISSADEITVYADILTGLEVGINDAAPTLYYRTNNGTGFGNFNKIKGERENISGKFKFVLPQITLGNVVDYYIAVQDTSSTFIASLPTGAKGFNPPGNIPPLTYYRFYVADGAAVFADNINNAVNWSLSGTAGISNNQYVSAPYSLTDSPAGNYAANTTIKIKMKNQVHLAGSLGAEILLKARWDIEYLYDYAQVQISTNNGSTWTALTGRYTKKGSGSFQPTNLPLYDGKQLKWIDELINISGYIGKDILIQFVLVTDGGVQQDGFYVDDISIKYYDKITNVDNNNDVVINNYNLSQNYPNPFNGQTIISFELPVQSNVSLDVYDILGRHAASVVNENLGAGKYTYNFNASNLSSGVYFYTLKTDNFNATRKLVLLK